MLSKSRDIIVKTYTIPAAASGTFVVKMHQSRKILGISGGYHGYQFLVEEPTGDYKKDFTFHLVEENKVATVPNGAKFLGTILVVTDPTADRPVGETRHVYGTPEGEQMGGAL